MRLFRQLFQHKLILLTVVILLFMQAACNMILPMGLTVCIDIGLKQGGILFTTPEKLPTNTYDLFIDFLQTEESKQDTEKSYDLVHDGDKTYYQLNAYGQENILKLDQYFTGIVSFMMKRNDGGSKYHDMLYQYDRNRYSSVDIEKLRDEVDKYEKATVEDKMYVNAVKNIESMYDEMGLDRNELVYRFIFPVAVIMVIVILVYLLVSVLAVILSSNLSFKITTELRAKLMKKILNLEVVEKNKFMNSSLLTRMVNDVQNVQSFLMSVVNMYPSLLFSIIAGVIFILLICPQLSWIIVVFLFVAMAITAVIFALSFRIFPKVQVAIDNANMTTTETIKGISTVRLYNNNKRQEKKFKGNNKNLFKLHTKSQLLFGVASPLISLGLSIASVMIVWYGGFEAENYDLSIGMLVVFINYSMQILTCFVLSLINVMVFPQGIASANRIEEVLHAPDTKQVKEIYLDTETADVIEFKDVDYAYTEDDELALDKVSFKVKPNTVNAFVGETGCGKSSIFKLIMGFDKVKSGEVDIYGSDINDIPEDNLRELTSYAPQKSFVFSVPVKNNITFGNKDIDEKKLDDVVDKSGLANFEHSLDYLVSQEGNNLSGGQRQRINYARAMYADPKIMIMDDFCSAVDANTEKKIVSSVKDLAKDKTILITTNRVSILKQVDNIFVMEEGKIISEGSHTELLEKCNKYRALFINQLENQ